MEPEASAANGKERYDLQAAPFEQFICRDEPSALPAGLTSLERKPKGWLCARCCLYVCCTGCCEHHCLTRTLSEAVKLQYRSAGMYPGGTFKRNKFPEGPPTKLGRREKAGVEVLEAVAPLVHKPADPAAPACETVEDKNGTPGLLLRVFKPLTVSDPSSIPVMVYLHGGGFVIGDPRGFAHDKTGEMLARKMGAYVVVPHYRRAPENPFPVPVMDSYDALRWVASESADEVMPGVDRSRLAIGGESAGGNLTVVLATLLRDGLQADLTPATEELQRLRLVFLAPLFPLLHLDAVTTSARANLDSPMLTGFSIDFFTRAYLGETEAERNGKMQDRRVNPLLAERGMEGLPPTTIVSGGRDLLGDDAKILEQALKLDGVPVRHLHRVDGVHVYHILPWEKGSRAWDFVIEGWQEALSGALQAASGSASSDTLKSG